MKKEKFDLNNFEVLKDSSNGKLMGGFSQTTALALAWPWTTNNCPVTNNCDGGNCVRGCGDK